MFNLRICDVDDITDSSLIMRSIGVELCLRLERVIAQSWWVEADCAFKAMDINNEYPSLVSPKIYFRSRYKHMSRETPSEENRADDVLQFGLPSFLPFREGFCPRCCCVVMYPPPDSPCF